MASQTQTSPTAKVYARSLLELARQRNLAEPIGKDLAAIGQILRDTPSFAAFLRDPGIRGEERTRVIDQVLKPSVDPLLANFLGVLNANGRLNYLEQITVAYANLLDELLGKIEVDVTTAQRLAPADLDKVRQSVSATLGRDAIVHQYVDESIIGGLVLRVQDKLIDASVKTQLQTIKRQLLAARPR